MFNVEVLQEDLFRYSKIIKTAVLKTALIKLEITDLGKLKLSSNDGISAIVCLCNADVKDIGSVVLPMSKFCEIIERLEGKIILKEEEKGLLIIENNKTVFNLETLRNEDFLNYFIPSLNNAPPVLFDKQEFLSCMKKVSCSALAEGNYSVLCGVNFSFEDNKKAEMVATDGNRLSFCRLQYEGEKQESFICPSPLKFSELIKNIKNDIVKIKVLSDKNKIFLESDDICFVTQMLNKTYPKYKQLIPTSFIKTVTIDRQNFLNSLLKIIIMIDEKTNAVKLDFLNNELTLHSSNDKDYNSAQDILLIEGDSFAEPFSVALNYRFLLDCLKANSEDKISIRLNTEISACVFESDFTTLIMPIHTSK